MSPVLINNYSLSESRVNAIGRIVWYQFASVDGKPVVGRGWGKRREDSKEAKPRANSK